MTTEQDKLRKEIAELKERAELHWISKEGYDCFVTLIDGRHRCGYVVVDENNITIKINSYDDVPLNVHGGLTYGSNGIWGFDFAHWGDTLEIWTLEKVKKEVEDLSEQLSKITWEEIIKAKIVADNIRKAERQRTMEVIDDFCFGDTETDIEIKRALKQELTNNSQDGVKPTGMVSSNLTPDASNGSDKNICENCGKLNKEHFYRVGYGEQRYCYSFEDKFTPKEKKE